MTTTRNAAALALPTPPPLLSPAILCTKRRAASGCRRCGAFAAPRTAIHAPVRGLRLNRIRATGPGPCLDRRHGPCLDGCRGPSLGGLHGLLHFTPALCTKRRTTSRCRRCGACPAPQTAIHAPVRGLRLNTIQAPHPRPGLDGRHDPCLDGCQDPSLGGSHGPSSLGGVHDLLRFMPALCTKRRTASW